MSLRQEPGFIDINRPFFDQKYEQVLQVFGVHQHENDLIKMYNLFIKRALPRIQRLRNAPCSKVLEYYESLRDLPPDANILLRSDTTISTCMDQKGEKLTPGLYEALVRDIINTLFICFIATVPFPVFYENLMKHVPNTDPKVRNPIRFVGAATELMESRMRVFPGTSLYERLDQLYLLDEYFTIFNMWNKIRQTYLTPTQLQNAQKLLREVRTKSTCWGEIVFYENLFRALHVNVVLVSTKQRKMDFLPADDYTMEGGRDIVQPIPLAPMFIILFTGGHYVLVRRKHADREEEAFELNEQWHRQLQNVRVPTTLTANNEFLTKVLGTGEMRRYEFVRFENRGAGNCLFHAVIQGLMASASFFRGGIPKMWMYEFRNLSLWDHSETYSNLPQVDAQTQSIALQYGQADLSERDRYELEVMVPFLRNMSADLASVYKVGQASEGLTGGRNNTTK